MASSVLGKRDGWTIYSAPIAATAGARNELVAAVSGKKIKVFAMMGMANVAGSLTLESATTAISGVMPVAATGGAVLPLASDESGIFGWAITAAGEALNLTTVTCTFNGILVCGVQD